ncbi:MAG: hypothetical protein M9916_10250 [Crocinitomicaceae bacterium]|nr:hypothetical protein [Crocinitomicaceae bacterium]
MFVSVDACPGCILVTSNPLADEETGSPGFIIDDVVEVKIKRKLSGPSYDIGPAD